MDRRMEQGLRVPPMIKSLRSFPRKRESSSWFWVPAFAGTSGRLMAALLLPVFLVVPASAQFGPPELIEAARKEGKLVFYSANVAESQTPVINAFKNRFPS